MIDLPRGTVTFLFTDVERSTQSWEHHPEVMRGALARHDAIVRTAIRSQGGEVFKTVGDAFYAVFETASPALRASLRVQRALQAEDWGELGPLRVRSALHTGAADVRDGDYFGPTLNRVSRLLSAGHGGQILLSQVTFSLVQDTLPEGIALRNLGDHRLKDLIRSEQIFQVVAPDLPDNFAPLVTLDSRPNNLPVQSTPLIGRERELEEATQRLRRADVRLLTLVGPGGIGKTRLAQQIAADVSGDYDDGVFFISLGDVVDPRLVPPRIAQTIGVKKSAGQSIAERVREALEHRRLLLVLDNFEQVESAADVVADLLSGCPWLKVVVTSRAPLHLRGEYEFSVPALLLPERKRLPPLEQLQGYAAIRLFAERAEALKPGFVVTSQNASAIVEICHRLDGLPLAIELAAARVKVFPPAMILERLGNRLQLLTTGPRDAPQRQQTLRNTIAWSYDLLSEPEMALFRRLAVFADGCSIASVESICADVVVDVVEGLAALVDRSLLRQQERNGEARFEMLATIQEYAVELLLASGDADLVRARHAAFFLALAEEAALRYRAEGPESRLWRDLLDREQANLRAALACYLDSDPVLGLRLAAALGWPWIWRGELAEGEGWLATFLSLAPAETLDRGQAILALASFKRDKGDLDAAQPLFEEALSLCRRAGDVWGTASALIYLAYQAIGAGTHDLATTFAEESLAIVRENRDPSGVGRALSVLAGLHRLRGDLDQSAHLAKRHCDSVGIIRRYFCLDRSRWKKATTIARRTCSRKSLRNRDITRMEVRQPAHSNTWASWPIGEVIRFRRAGGWSTPWRQNDRWVKTPAPVGFFTTWRA